MTDKEKAIVMAYTGACMLCGDKFQIFHKYIEDIMGRPIMTHEIGWLADAIKEKSKTDFIALCEEQEPTLDKIRAEIEQITDTMGVSYNQYVSKIDVLQIIDKYKAESEG
jgi:hypothetical protein